jgi:hypothetical protein
LKASFSIFQRALPDAAISESYMGPFGGEMFGVLNPLISIRGPQCLIGWQGDMAFSYEMGRPSLHFVKNHPANWFQA